jgi:PPM family protein phosphatase
MKQAAVSAAPRTLLALSQTAAMEPVCVDTEAARVVACSLASPAREGSLNEDCAAAVTCASGHELLIVTDGVGSSRQGHLAAQIAMECLVQAAHGVRRNTTRIGTTILDAIEEADDRIRALGTGAATTVAIAEICAGQLRTWHVGDSTVLVCGQRGKVRLMTVGHSPTELAVDAGWLEPAEALVHHERHLVTNALGLGRLRIETGPPVRLYPCDTVLVASDGLFDNLLPVEVIDIIRRSPVEASFGRLLDETRARMTGQVSVGNGKPDDLTAIAWRQLRPRAAAHRRAS